MRRPAARGARGQPHPQTPAQPRGAGERADAAGGPRPGTADPGDRGGGRGQRAVRCGTEQGIVTSQMLILYLMIQYCICAIICSSFIFAYVSCIIHKKKESLLNCYYTLAFLV